MKRWLGVEDQDDMLPPEFGMQQPVAMARRPRRHPTWRRAVPVWRNRTRRHRRLDAYAGPDPSQAVPGESFSMGQKRKRPPSGVLILTTGRTDQIANDLVLADLLLWVKGGGRGRFARCRLPPRQRRNRWGNRPASLWIAEDFRCCASG